MGNARKSIYETQRNERREQLFSASLLLILTPLILILTVLIYDRSYENMIRMGVLGLLTGTILLFVFLTSHLKEESNIRNRNSISFVFVFLVCLVVICIFPLIPNLLWPFLPVALILFFYSDALTGIMSSSFLLSLAVLLDGGSITVFFLYFLAGMITIAVFRTVNYEFKVQSQFIILLSSYLLLHGIFSILPMKQIYLQDLLMIVLNVFVSTILLFFVFWIYGITEVHKNLPKYLEMNDPEYPVMKSLKEINKNEYYKLIHTAYLSEKLARELHAKQQLVRGLSYYHQLGCPREKNMEKSTEEILAFSKEHHIPYDLYQLLLEFHNRKQSYVSREAIIVYLSDQVVCSILYLFAKDKNSQIDYHQLVDVLFEKKLESGFFNESNLTMKEIQYMKKMLIEEKLYYDFLR